MSDNPIHIEYNQELKPLEKLISGVVRHGDYFVTGTREIPMPKMEVEGVGVLSFPVPASQIAALIQQATRAPYGRGEETILDTSVRKVWQLPAGNVRLGGKSWSANFESILATVAVGLGREITSVVAELYKVLVYDVGGFFQAHRDTEKTEAMFGTLVLVLPSPHRGGELVIRHAGREIMSDLSRAETSEVAFAAFYADCEHEVRPITEGNRLCLVYNLIQKRAKPNGIAQLTAPDYQSEITAATTILQEWTGLEHSSVKIAWLLEHHYSPAGLSFSGLKNSDSARAKVLAQAATRAGCAVYLGIVHIEESGSAEPNYDSPRRRRYYGEETEEETGDFEVVEVCDSWHFVDHWIDTADRPVDFGSLPLAGGELLPDGALDGDVPDEQRLMEATGNEGASFERSYHRAAIVIWDHERYPEVLLQSGVGAAMIFLKKQIETHLAKSATAPTREEIVSIAWRIVKAWQSEGRGWVDPRSSVRAGNRAEMLEALILLEAAQLLEEFVANVVTGHYDGSENTALVSSAPLLGAAKAGALFAALAKAQMRIRFQPCVELLRALVEAKGTTADAGWPGTLHKIASAVVAGLEDVNQLSYASSDNFMRSAEKPAVVVPELVVQLFEALKRINAEALRETAAQCISARPEVFDPVTVVVPALALLRSHGTPEHDRAILHLWTRCAEFLLDRSEVAPLQPQDWQQAVTLRCTCVDCRELQAFVLAPERQVYRFRARMDRRNHLQSTIMTHDLEMSYVTDRQGSPQTLVCTKNRRNHVRRLAQYRSDLATMATLKNLFVTAVNQENKIVTLLTRLKKTAQDAV